MKQSAAGTEDLPLHVLPSGDPSFLRRLAWILIALLTVAAAGVGVVAPSVYVGLVEEPYVPGTFSQDVMSVAAALVLLSLALAARASRPRLELVVLGLLGYLVYAYGVYTIERVYNWLYLIYMAIFAAALWSVIYETLALCRRTVLVTLPKSIRLVSATGALLQPLMFYPLWIGTLLPLMAERQKIETIYSIFILDLCLIMPAFLILGIAAFRGRQTGLLLLPAAYVLGFALILSLAAAEPAKELFGSRFDPVAFWLWLALSLFFLVLGLLHLRLLRVHAAPALGPVLSGESK